MATMISIIVIIWLNYITDYLFQSQSMSENKHHSLFWLLAHVADFTIAFGVAVLVFNGMTHYFNWGNLVILILINGVSHLIIDFFTSKITAYYYKKRKIGTFLRVIGADQTLHVTILVILTFFLIK